MVFDGERFREHRRRAEGAAADHLRRVARTIGNAELDEQTQPEWSDLKRWAETRDVLERLHELQASGTRAAMATVVRVVGSAYRREGAKMLVAEDGTTRGNVSGGCLEEDVREVALGVIASGRPELREYCSGVDEIHAWDLGVGCDGQVDVFVTPHLSPPAAALTRLAGDDPFALIRSVDPAVERGSQLVVTGRSIEGGLGDDALDLAAARLARELLGDGEPGLHEIDGKPLFVEVFRPPPSLVIFGAGDDARPLAGFAVAAGFRVVIVDRRAGMLAGDRFPRRTRRVHADAETFFEQVKLDENTYVVTMTHSYADDLGYLSSVVRTPVAYIGMLGPRHRTERILGVIREQGRFDERRVHGPVGLDIGAVGAEQVALSILAEILADHAGRRGGSLRDRLLPIHAVAAD